MANAQIEEHVMEQLVHVFAMKDFLGTAVKVSCDFDILIFRQRSNLNIFGIILIKRES